MENFTFFNPTKIEFGTGKEQLIGQHLAEHGIKKVLLCYGSDRIKRDGLFAVVSKSLAEHGMQFVECGGIVSNPVISKVREAIALARDTSGRRHPERRRRLGARQLQGHRRRRPLRRRRLGFVHRQGRIERRLPVFDILTLAATGSEMNNGAVVTNEETKEKFAIGSVHTFPKVSIVNPALMQDGVARLSGVFRRRHHRPLDRRLFHGNRATAVSTRAWSKPSSTR